MSRKPIVSNALISLMREDRRHAWTLEALQAGLAENGLSADFSSVFRAAEKLVVDGIAIKVLADDGCARFELSAPHHDHLLCLQCGELIAVPCLIGRAEFSALETQLGVSISEHSLTLRGLCPTCRAAEGR